MARKDAKLLQKAKDAVSKSRGKRESRFTEQDWKMVDKVFGDLKKSEETVQIFGMMTGIIIEDRITPELKQTAFGSLSDISALKDLSEKEITQILDWFIEQDALSLLLAPGVANALFVFIKQIGFPATLGAAQTADFEAPRYHVDTLLSVLVGANVLSVVEVPAIDALDAKHNAEEMKLFKENPKEKVDVYEYDQAFIRGLGNILRKIGAKEEQVTHPGMKFLSETRKGKDMESLKRLEALELQIKNIQASSLTEAKKDSEDSETGTDHEHKVFKAIDDDDVEKFVEGLLIILGELESTGKIPKIENPQQARDAVLAAVRRMYQKRSLISKLTRKYSRFGAKRVLRRARQEIGKALA